MESLQGLYLHMKTNEKKKVHAFEASPLFQRLKTGFPKHFVFQETLQQRRQRSD